jgi:hypothetical protein
LTPHGPHEDGEVGGQARPVGWLQGQIEQHREASVCHGRVSPMPQQHLQYQGHLRTWDRALFIGSAADAALRHGSQEAAFSKHMHSVQVIKGEPPNFCWECGHKELGTRRG